MLRTIVLVASKLITRAEFMQFLQTMGADISNDDQVYNGQLYNHTGGYLWIKYNPEEELSGSELEARIKSITDKLGSPPQTEILIDIGKNFSSGILAAELVSKFSQIWSCVVEDDDLSVYSVPEFMKVWVPDRNRVGESLNNSSVEGDFPTETITHITLHLVQERR